MENVRGMGDRLFIAGGILGVIASVYIIGTVIYNRFFHPLAKFPGPFLNAVSDVSPSASVF